MTPGRITLELLWNALDAVARMAEPDDVIVLFLSGHGVVLPGEQMFYFATSDTIYAVPEGVRYTALSSAMLVDVLRRTRARRVLLVVDSCQAGGALEAVVRSAKFQAQARGGEACSPTDGTGVVAIASALPVQAAVQGTSSVMATALLQALDTKPAQGSLWASDVAADIARRLPALAAQMSIGGAPVQQHPLIETVGIDFPLGQTR